MKKSTKVFTLSDESKNLYEFTVLTAGIDRTDFDNNPVCLYNHDYDQLLGLWGDLSIGNNQLLGVPSFDEEDPNAMKQYSKAEQGILRGASIGIVPIEYDSVNQIMRRCSLKEVSLTPVPANRNAIAIYNSKGQKLNAQQAKQYLLSLEAEIVPIMDNKKHMNQKLITALVALCLQAGHTISLSADSKEEEFESAIKKVGAHITELSTAKTNLTAEVKKLTDAAAAAEDKALDDYLAEAVNKKTLSADDVPSMKAFGKTNLSAMKKVVDALKPIEVKTIESQSTTVVGLSGDRAKWTYDDFAEKAPRDLEAMETTNPELFKKLSADKIASVRSKVEIPA